MEDILISHKIPMSCILFQTYQQLFSRKKSWPPSGVGGQVFPGSATAGRTADSCWWFDTQYHIMGWRSWGKLPTGRAIYTNGPISGAFRGFGVPQAAAIQETLLAQLAEKCNLDPFFKMYICTKILLSEKHLKDV